ncbi:MAG TPA: E3 binding domain-containing protein [Flavipsychrobacter sp.]|nr:E3 binding domain-containing protein [Flavipsychrobacter sp.]
MAIVDLVMPKMGESIMEATVLKWHKAVGDAVKMDETVLEIATDKVDSEVPSTAAGTITEILFKENDVVPVGTVIVRINTSGDSAASAPAPAAAPTPQPAPAPQPITTPAQPIAAPTVSTGDGNKFYSPLVLNIAGKEGIGMAELERIPGTGNEGRVTKKDILQYVANRASGAAAPAPAAPVAATPAIPVQSAVVAASVPAAPAEAPKPVATMVIM